MLNPIAPDAQPGFELLETNLADPDQGITAWIDHLKDQDESVVPPAFDPENKPRPPGK